jgi:hypothetical protein
VAVGRRLLVKGMVALCAVLLFAGCGSVHSSDQFTYSVPGVPTVPGDVRRDVTATLDAFVVAGVERKDLSRAYDLSTPTLRGGLTREQWLTGSIPVAPYPGRETHVGRWQPTFITPDSIGLHVILHPEEGADVGPQSYNIVVRKLNGRWLVDNIYPEAMFATAGSAATIVAEPDYAPHQQGRVERHSNHGLLAVPFLILGAPLLIGLAALAVVVVRHVRRPAPEADDRALIPWKKPPDDPAT